MKKKVLAEWTIRAPWGDIAMISWGNPTGYPVLLLHGREDSIATFMPLLELLPDDFYYVGFDLPGNGRSEAFPIGVMMMRFTNVVAMDIVVEHLQWKEFFCLGHSLGTEISCFYNAIYPHRVKKLVHLDPMPAWRKIQIRAFPDYMEHFFHNYYENYRKQNANDKVYSKRSAVEAVMRARGLTRELAEIVLSRNLIQIGEDRYRLSWDRRLKLPASLNFANETYRALFSMHCPPSLILHSLNTTRFQDGSDDTIQLMKDIEKSVDDYAIIEIDGDHDVHLKHPERIASFICDFLTKDFSKKAKL